MSSGQFPLPPPGGSSVLDRVKMFLPAMAAANEELERQIREHGVQSVQIDSHIASKPTEAVSQDANGDCASSSDEEDEVPTANETNDASKEARMIELNIALGDFDDSNIALLEELGKAGENDEEPNDIVEDDDI